MPQKPACAPPKNVILIRGRDHLNSEESKMMARFGPVYKDEGEGEGEGEAEANRKAKDSAWNHIVQNSHGVEEAELKRDYMGSIARIEVKAMGSYDPTVVETLKSKSSSSSSSFLWMMVRDGCFFLQIALHILGAGDLLRYPPQHPYFGKESDSSSWLPAMFWIGNQIPCVVISALMKQTFFQNVIKKGRWQCPTDDLEKLALYLTLVEPELERPKWMHFFRRKPPQFRDDETPSNILDALHSLVLGSGDNDPIHSEMKEFRELEDGGGDSLVLGSGDNDPRHSVMKEFRDLEASNIKIPSAGELKKSGISLRKANGSGITNIRFQNLGFCACLYLPPFTINDNTERIFTVLASYENNLNKSDREVTSYLRFMRDLSCTYKDFKILERKGIIRVQDNKLKCNMVNMLHNIIKDDNSRFTLNFRHTRRRLKDYGGPPWRLISLLLGVLTIVQTVFTVLSYFFPHK